MRFWNIQVMLACLAFAPMEPVSAQEIWFSPSARSPDFVNLFRQDAPWTKAASAMQAFEISNELTYNHLLPDEQLTQLYSDLRRRHIGVVIGIPGVTGEGPGGSCGYNVEGYGPANSLRENAHRIKLLGGDPILFSLDEPLYFGHVFLRDGERVGCRLPIEVIAAGVSDRLRQIRQTFPTARFGDVEPFPISAIGADEWVKMLTDWFDAYFAATGQQLAFFRLDMAWTLGWQAVMPRLLTGLRNRGIPVQVIYNGNGSDRSDEAWLTSAVSHFNAFESNATFRPDVAMIQSWNKYPSRALPETDSRTLTWLVNRYATFHQVRN